MALMSPRSGRSVAVQKTQANRNSGSEVSLALDSVAVQKTQANRNEAASASTATPSVAVQKTQANRNMLR